MKTAFIIVLIFFLQACMHSPRPGGYYQDDGPHARAHIDPSKVADAIPRIEPLSPRGNKPYTVFGKTYRPLPHARGYQARGVASWYGKKFHGRQTSNGEVYDMYAMSAAHTTLPLPSYVRVTNLRNSKSVIVRVNDRGPFLHNRLIDLSYAAAAKLDIVRTGTGQVEISAIDTRQAGAKPAMPNLLAQTQSPGAKATARPESGKLYLQVGAFSQRVNADKLRSRLQSQIDTPISIIAMNSVRGQIYRVRVGPLATVEESGELAERMVQLGVNDAIIVSE